ncbi:CHAT domain-containing protein [Oscillatoria sp. FACHB-1407]|uniref:CHAT domain-containing protein n=2 Tax=Oscillatoria sp. FACHB-1407 TaxID=2692847 RepID=UPI0030DBA617
MSLSLLLVMGRATSFTIPDSLANGTEGRSQISSSEGNSIPTAVAIAPENSIQQGRDAYQNGRFAQAVEAWEQAAIAYQEQGNDVQQALASSYLALAHQQLGAWAEAQAAIATSMALLQNQQISSNPQHRLILAQAWNTQGSLQFAQGQIEDALTSWQRATTLYAAANDSQRYIGSLINQAQAQQSLGLYLQARRTLSEVERSLQQQPDSELKAIGLQTLAEILRTVGDLDQARQQLEQSLAIAEQLNLPPLQSTALLSLGNIAQAQEELAAALTFYQRAATPSAPALTRVQAQLNQLHLLITTEQWSQAQALLPNIETQLDALSPSRDTIYARINAAQQVVAIAQREQPDATTLYSKAAQILVIAIQHAKQLNDSRAEAYALGQLGHVYETTRQWQEAQTLTEQALLMAQSVNAADVAYQWQWQLGRLLKAQQQPSEALKAYRAAFDTLQSIRRDLIATSSDLQFSFRDSVEPVYRELVDLLLQRSPNSQQEPTQANLQEARQVIESLQLAELDNFFRAACLDGQRVAIDQIDQTDTAVIYPIVLSDRLEVLLSLPQQPIRQYTASVSQAEIEQAVAQLQQQLARPLTSQQGQQLGQRLYDWLIRPLETELATHASKTLVFVLDGALRNIPMATLYDGDRYLIEQYSLALAPGLQLLNPQPLSQNQLEVLAAGLTQERSGFSALVNVENELNEIKAKLPSQILLNEAFTSSALQTQIDALPFPIVHLATHGQFSSKADETFILAWDRPINVNELSSLLRNSDDTRSNPIELLVLSACETAAGDTRATLGLAGIAVQAGARSTLASLWVLNDESAARFISQFYQELADTTVSKAEALQRAQLALLRDPNYRHPIYWAPYVLIGNWL